MAASARQLKSKISYDSIDDRDILSLISTIKQGISYNSFLSIAGAIPFTMNEWSDILNISERTMQRFKKEKRTFDQAQSERILQIVMLNKLGVEVFGSEEKFNFWLETNNVALGNVKPKTFLDNSFGIGLLKDELTRIEYGVLA